MADPCGGAGIRTTRGNARALPAHRCNPEPVIDLAAPGVDGRPAETVSGCHGFIAGSRADVALTGVVAGASQPPPSALYRATN